MKRLLLFLVLALTASLGFAVCPPLPSVLLTATPAAVDSGGTSQLAWSSNNADSCTASGAWTGLKAVGGTEAVGPLAAASAYTLTCTNIAGDGSATASVAINAPPPPLPPPGSTSGLRWPGDADVTRVRSQLIWDNVNNPFPRTYLFKVLPQKKTTGPHKYYTTFFWGRNGPFNNNEMYYGAHPYPAPPPGGAGHWEAAMDGSDPIAPQEVEWNRWHTQAVVAYRVGGQTFLDFYYDWPNTSKVVRGNGWVRSSPNTPAIFIGQTPDDGFGNSWGGYGGWEDFKGVIRGIQMYSAKLSLADIQKEIDLPLSSQAGLNSIWYLNLNPRPSDVTDKKSIGTPNNPRWVGTPAFEWSE